MFKGREQMRNGSLCIPHRRFGSYDCKTEPFLSTQVQVQSDASSDF